MKFKVLDYILIALIVALLLILFSSCMNQREVVRHYQRAGVMPHGTNKKLNSFEKK
jgi:hypothetical protein